MAKEVTVSGSGWPWSLDAAWASCGVACVVGRGFQSRLPTDPNLASAPTPETAKPGARLQALGGLATAD